MDTLNEFWIFLRTRKRYWLWPLVFFVFLLGVFLFVAQSTALSTFIYSLF
jgi:hypothetical protein